MQGAHPGFPRRRSHLPLRLALVRGGPRALPARRGAAPWKARLRWSRRRSLGALPRACSGTCARTRDRGVIPLPRSPLFEALRPRQWTKNAFVFAGLLFGGQLFERAAVLRSLLAFAIFCAAASAVYLANDVADRDQDALHPMKRARPIASGRLGTRPAIATAVVAALAAVVGSAALSRPLLWIVLAYLLSSLLYTAGLKRVHVLDVMIVAAGFVLRAAAGAAALPVEISPWLLCCTFLLALYLAIAKRRAELSLLGEEAEQHRPALARYTVPLLDGWLVALTGAT
ncbi:MAG: hypothetical protein E6J62_01750, partial [Deltaproteobacteria bacterium]